MAEKVIFRCCDWCELTREGNDAADPPELWIHLELDSGVEHDYCSMECLIAHQ